MFLNPPSTPPVAEPKQIGKAILAAPSLPSPVDISQKKDIYSREDVPKLPKQPGKVKALAAPELPSNTVLGRRVLQPSEDTSLTKTTNNKKDAEDEFVETIARRRGWGKTLPTNNPHVLHALLKEPNPWKRMTLPGPSFPMISKALEELVYANPKFLKTAQYSPQLGDVVVLGLPRSGQTAILRILDCLQSHSSLSSSTSLLENTLFVENPNASMHKPLQSKRRIIKSHLPIASTFLQVKVTTLPPRIIIVLRNPLDLRLSYFRHVRKMYTKCTQTPCKQFDEAFPDMDTIVSSTRELNLPVPGSKTEDDFSVEEFTASALQALELANAASNNVLIIFYEELLSHPVQLVHRLARFTNFMQDIIVEDAFAPKKVNQSQTTQELDDMMIRNIAEILKSDGCHPDSGNRVGSSGQGVVCISKANQDALNLKWKTAVPHFSTYETLYSAVTGERYLFGSNKTKKLSHLMSMPQTPLGSFRTVLPPVTSSGFFEKEEAPPVVEEKKKAIKARTFGGSFLSLLSLTSSSKNLLATPSSPSFAVNQGRTVASSSVSEDDAWFSTPRREFHACADPDDDEDEDV